MPAIARPLCHHSDVRYRSFFLLALFLLASSLLPILTLTPLFAHAFAAQPISPVAANTLMPNRTACHYAGVFKDTNGVYHFSWLHVDSATGFIMDQQNCIVNLRGFNSAGTEYADGVSPFPGLNAQRLTWFNSMFKMNFIRLNLNVDWWNNNVYVPNAHLSYRPWIQQWISWAEQSGDYVLLNRTNEYTLPPCGGSITYCPAQTEPSDVNDTQPQQQFNAGYLLTQTLAFWNSIVALYKNDPAILYNDWNELHDISASTWQTVHTTLITAIRAINPRSLIVLGSNDWNNTMNPITSGQVRDLSYPNLVYDWHIYDGVSGQSNGQPCAQGKSYIWANWGAASNAQFHFAQQHRHGAIIDEWGGCLDDPTYNTALSSYAASNHIGMAYYMAGNVVNNTWTALNSNGVLAQAAYARFGN